MTKKNKTSNPAPVSKNEETPTATVEVLSATPETPAPAPEKRPLGFRTLGARDAYGYGSDTEVSFLARLLSEGTRTKKELLSAFLSRYVPDGNEAETKRKKTSFSVFFSDSRRPIGTYHASRSFVILEEEGTGRLSLDPARDEAVKEAIRKGILSELRGVKPGTRKAAEVLAKYGLPSEEK